MKTKTNEQVSQRLFLYASFQSFYEYFFFSWLGLNDRETMGHHPRIQLWPSNGGRMARFSCAQLSQLDDTWGDFAVGPKLTFNLNGRDVKYMKYMNRV